MWGIFVVRQARVEGTYYVRASEREGLEDVVMNAEFTAVVERDEDWFIAYCPEVPGANGQGKSKGEALESLAEAISLILEDRREDGLRGIPKDAVLEKVTVK